MTEFSLNTVIGFTSPGTLKVRGNIENEDVVVLVDCGATHNFISTQLVEKMKIPISETANYDIIMGTDTVVRGKGMCKGWWSP